MRNTTKKTINNYGVDLCYELRSKVIVAASSQTPTAEYCDNIHSLVVTVSSRENNFPANIRVNIVLPVIFLIATE